MSKILVAYFSASGQTKKLAQTLAKASGGNLFEIEPEQEYTNADLNWMDKNSRTTIEMQDRECRPKIKNSIDISAYDCVFVGFPIWWYREPSIIDTFVEQYNFSGKTIIPFATSGGSSLGQTYLNLQNIAPKAKVLRGERFNANASESELASWLKKLGL